MTHEPDFYNKNYQNKFRGDDTKTYQTFGLPIGNAKKKVKFHPEASVIKYHQKLSNSCYLSGLNSAFRYIGDDRAVTVLVNRIQESLTLQTEKLGI